MRRARRGIDVSLQERYKSQGGPTQRIELDLETQVFPVGNTC